jgi:hypothetical protein
MEAETTVNAADRKQATTLGRTPGWMRWALPVAGSARAAMALTAPTPARAATYKWVDDKGVVHYTDKMPPEAVNKGSIELNKQACRSRRPSLR